MGSPDERPVTHLFTDIGGVLLTNGWDRKLRADVAAHFGVDVKEFEERHHLNYETHEMGKMTFARYLERSMFFEPRAFSVDDVVKHIAEKARAYPEMIALWRQVKAKHALKVAAVSNEGRELGVDRIRRFRLHDVIDVFVISGMVGLRKPDPDIFRLAFDTAQAEPGRVVYVDDCRPFAELATELGMKGVWHVDRASTAAALATHGIGI